MERTVGPEVLGRWSAGSGPLYRRLADALRTAVARGDVPVDSRLPAERVLARSLNVSRNTVVNAYDLLDAEGLLVRRKGSGTWVAPHTAAAARRTHLRRVWAPQAALRSIVDNPGNVIPFTASTVDRVPDALPRDAFDVGFDEVVDAPPYFETPAGLPELRGKIAALYEARGLPTSPEQVVVTAGAQQAILLVATVRLTSGDLAVLESPTFPGAIDALSVLGARLRGVPVGPHGADVTCIERSVVQGHVGLVYLVPSFHNPTGALMPEGRRREVAAISSRWGVPVIDDESLVDLSLGPEPPPPIAAFAPDAPVFTVGSVSKLFWGGLRIGWVRCPPDAVGPVVRLKSVSDLSSSLVSQAIALRLLDHRGHMVYERRRQLTSKLRLYTTYLRELLPSWRFDPPSGGLSLWVDTGVDAAAFAQVALREGVALVTSAETAVDNLLPSYVRLPLMLDDELIVEGVARLRRAYERFAEDGEAPPAVQLVV